MKSPTIMSAILLMMIASLSPIKSDLNTATISSRTKNMARVGVTVDPWDLKRAVDLCVGLVCNAPGAQKIWYPEVIPDPPSQGEQVILKLAKVAVKMWDAKPQENSPLINKEKLELVLLVKSYGVLQGLRDILNLFIKNNVEIKDAPVIKRKLEKAVVEASLVLQPKKKKKLQEAEKRTSQDPNWVAKELLEKVHARIATMKRDYIRLEAMDVPWLDMNAQVPSLENRVSETIEPRILSAHGFNYRTDVSNWTVFVDNKAAWYRPDEVTSEKMPNEHTRQVANSGIVKNVIPFDPEHPGKILEDKKDNGSSVHESSVHGSSAQSLKNESLLEVPPASDASE